MKRVEWTNTLVLFFFHLAAAFAIVYLAVIKASPWTIGLGVVWLACCSLSITAGYHRLFAHPTYQASAPMRVLYLLFGAASVQNSALKWAADHRLHHAHEDDDQDPYNIQKGFWWAHIGWVLFKSPPSDPRLVKDLQRGVLLRLQHRYYIPLAFLMGALVPAAIGTAWGDPIGAMLVAGFLRLVLQWHCTFSVNSVAHLIGHQPFCKRSSARDCFLTALITLGEGYHNFHHRFKSDYRNGVRWFHFDPTKWFLWTMSKVGAVRNLRRTAREVIERAKREVRVRSRRPVPVRAFNHRD
ncbi:MAG TPA: fatty acid desaturase [Planctomycetota bacterium]|nr:fatty acid desaturase [Planctomycetota bacterium]